MKGQINNIFFYREPCLLVDEKGQIFAILAGRPLNGKDWDEVIRRMVQEFEEACEKMVKDTGTQGEFSRLETGYSYGGGQTVSLVIDWLSPNSPSPPQRPQNRAHDTNQPVIEQLLLDKNVQQVANFQSSAFAMYAPKMYETYSRTVNALCTNDVTLRQPFPGSVFPCVTFNLGPHSVCFMHIDSKNVPYRLCSITSTGTYNPVKGGHLVLGCLCKYIQFPPGSTIFIPLATIDHRNMTTSDNETRYLFTQYCAGALMC